MNRSPFFQNFSFVLMLATGASFFIEGWLMIICFLFLGLYTIMALTVEILFHSGTNTPEGIARWKRWIDEEDANGFVPAKYPWLITARRIARVVIPTGIAITNAPTIFGVIAGIWMVIFILEVAGDRQIAKNLL